MQEVYTKLNNYLNDWFVRVEKEDPVFHENLYNILFALLIVIITMRLSIQNKILYWLGKNLFGLYILQRIPMIILKHLNVHLSQPYIYVSLCFVLMIIIGGTFNFFTKNINLKKVD